MLTIDDMRRIEQTQSRRFIAERPNLVAVGFGQALRKGKPDSSRPLAALYLVRHKGRPHSAIIPSTVRTVKKNHGRLCVMDIPTDVIEIGDITYTGAIVSKGAVALVTGSAVVEWREHEQRQFGLLTVAHHLAHNAPPFNVALPNGNVVVLNYRHHTNRRSGMDASVLIASPEDRAKLASYAGSPRAILPVRSLPTVANGREFGQTHRKAAQPIIAEAFTPRLRDTAGRVRTVYDVLISVGNRSGTFRKGTSGSVWRFRNRLACLQYAGGSPQFRRGFAQSVDNLATYFSGILDGFKIVGLL